MPVTDVAALLMGLALARLLLGEGELSLFFFAAVVALGLATKDQYRHRLPPTALGEIPTLLGVVATVAASLVLIRSLLGADPSTPSIVDALLLIAGTLLAGRVVLSQVQRRLLAAGIGTRRVMICGSTPLARRLSARLAKQPQLGLRVVAVADPEMTDTEHGVAEELLPPGQDGPRTWLEGNRIEHLIVAMAPDLANRYGQLVKACDSLQIPVSYVARGLENRTAGHELDICDGVPLLRVKPHRPRSQVVVKHGIDHGAALVLLLLTAPLQIAVATAIRLTMGSPILYRQRRIGGGGKEFAMLKFRTMAPAEREELTTASRHWLPPDDVCPGGAEGKDRRTRLGRFLRRTSLDELPQLWNVARGEMSLIGPRPERPEYVELFLDEVHRYGERHRVRVGMTGLAQVQGLRGQTSLSERIEMDNYYIDNWSLWLDAQIAFRTIRAVFADPPE